MTTRLLLVATLIATGDAAVGQEAASAQRVQNAIERGVSWLRDEQSEDGSWPGAVGYDTADGYVGTISTAVGHAGTSSLAILALLETGLRTDDRSVKRGVEWLLAQGSPESGWLGSRGTRMHTHAVATWALAEVLAKNDKWIAVEERLMRAVDLLVKAQGRNGSWGYRIGGGARADITVTAVVVRALQRARAVGMYVPKVTLDRAVSYALQLKGEAKDGLVAFGYRPSRKKHRSFGTTASGVAILMLDRKKHEESIAQSVRWLEQSFGRHAFLPDNRSYRRYFGLLVGFDTLRAASQKAGVARLPERIRSGFLASQSSFGNWRCEGPGQVLGTAVAIMVLKK